jgi:hypothetical protein
VRHPTAAAASSSQTTTDLVFKAMVIALCASHGFIVVLTAIRYLLEKIVWEGSKEAEVG